MNNVLSPSAAVMPCTSVQCSFTRISFLQSKAIVIRAVNLRCQTYGENVSLYGLLGFVR